MAPGAADMDAAGALLRHLEQLDTKRLDVAALVREVERAERDTSGDGDASLSPATATLHATISATVPDSWYGAAKRAREARDSGAVSGVPLAVLPKHARPSLVLPFVAASAIIIAAVGVPVIRRAQTATSSAPAPMGAVAAVATAGHAASVSRPATGVADHAVHGVVDAYARAYANRDAAAVRAVFPTVEIARLQQTFAGLRRLDVQVEDEQIQVTGATATVACLWQTESETVDGTTERAALPIVLTLERRGDTWLVVNRY